MLSQAWVRKLSAAGCWDIKLYVAGTIGRYGSRQVQPCIAVCKRAIFWLSGFCLFPLLLASIYAFIASGLGITSHAPTSFSTCSRLLVNISVVWFSRNPFLMSVGNKGNEVNFAQEHDFLCSNLCLKCQIFYQSLAWGPWVLIQPVYKLWSFVVFEFLVGWAF